MNTGVAGLDVVLDGGLEPGTVVVVAGEPGTGKTILAQQVCFAIGPAAHKGVYYTTVSEPHTKLVRHLEPFTFFDAGSLGSRVEHIHLGDFLRPSRPDGLEPIDATLIIEAFGCRQDDPGDALDHPGLEEGERCLFVTFRGHRRASY